MKKSVAVVSRWRLLLVGLVLAAGATFVGSFGCSLGPKQDDPALDPGTQSDTGFGSGLGDTEPVSPADAAVSDAVTDTYDPKAGLDGCDGVDGGDAAAHEAGEGGCDAASDAAPDGGDGASDGPLDGALDGEGDARAEDAPDGEGESDGATGG